MFHSAAASQVNLCVSDRIVTRMRAAAFLEWLMIDARFDILHLWQAAPIIDEPTCIVVFRSVG